jgi:tetratricopeptide (TPR) repeat protein
MKRQFKNVLSPSLAALASLLILAACAANPPKEPDANPSPAAEQKVELKEPDPANAEALYDYAAALERNGDEAKALSYYLQATQVNPDYVKAHIALAQLYVKFNRMDEARVAYENILRLDRDNPFVAQYKEARLKYYSALNIAQNDEYDKALKLLAQAPRNTPLDREIEEIETKWKQNLQASSNQKAADDIIQQASLLAYKGQYTQAIELIKTAPDSANNDKVLAKIAQWEKALQERSSVQPIGPNGTTPPVATSSGPTKYVVSDNVNVRQSPYLYAQSLSVANRGTSVEILQDKAYESDGYRWTKVKTRDGQIGWVADSFLANSLTTAPATSAPPLPTTPQQTPSTDNGQDYGKRTINGDQVNVRSTPSLNGTLVTRAARGTDVTLLSSGATSADGYSWYKIRLPDNQVGWVASTFLGTARLVAPPPVAGSSTPTTSSTPKAPSTPATASTQSSYRYISGSGINVRSSASTSGSIITTVNQGDRVLLTSSKVVKAGGYNWVSIMTPDGKRGWIATNFLSTGAPKSAPAATAASTSRIVRGSDVNIRAEANTGAKIILVAQEGTRVTLMSSKLVQQGGHTWAKVRLSNGQLGWVVADYLGR